MRHRLLHGMRLRVCEVFDREDLCAVDRGQRNDAGIHRLVLQYPIMKSADQHRACAAVSLGAALFGAGESGFEPDKVQQRLVQIKRRSVLNLSYSVLYLTKFSFVYKIVSVQDSFLNIPFFYLKFS